MDDADGWISLDYEELRELLARYDREMPGIARKMMAAVNSQVRKSLKREARARGYSAHKAEAWGDAGYTANIRTYANRDYTAAVLIGRNAFHYRFIEYGARQRPASSNSGGYLVYMVDGRWVRTRGYDLPARPLLRPVADSIWKTARAQKIMDERLQKELDRMDGGRG